MIDRTKTLALFLTAALTLGAAACADDAALAETADDAITTDMTAATGATTGEGMGTDTAATGTPPGGRGGGGAGAVSAESVSTEDELITLVQRAYGDPALGLHRGHQPVESTLIDVLDISHDEMHVRMEDQGQNLAAVATDLGIDPQTLVDALVDSWAPAVDTLVEDGTLTEEEGGAYRAALEEAFTFRVTWNGEDATPTFSGN